METFTIASLAVQVRGVSYKPEDLHSSLDDSSVILLRANNIDDGKINFDDVVFVDKKRVSNEQFLRKGDILVCASSGSKNLVGKAASVDFDKEVTFGAFCKTVRPCNIEDAEYLAMFFQSPIYRRQIAATAIGANINNIRNEHIDTLSVKWPATVKRKEIVDILSKVEAIIRICKKQLSSLDDLIKARFVEMFGDAVINPYRYEQVTIGDACTLINGRAFKPSDWGEEGLPIVRIQNLNDTNASFNYYDGQVNEQHLIDSGMLLFSWSGTPGTSFGAFMWNRGPGALNQHIFKVIPKLDFDLDYLRYAMNGQLSTIIAKAHGGVGLQHITKAELEKIVLLHPKMREQKQFAAFVTQIDKSKSVIQKTLDETQLLFDSLMQKYFG